MIVVPALVNGFLINPILYLWLGLALLRGRSIEREAVSIEEIEATRPQLSMRAPWRFCSIYSCRAPLVHLRTC